MTQKKLTERQRRFVEYYIETGNITEAAKLKRTRKPSVFVYIDYNVFSNNE